ncbi:MAG TPA: NUDIX hydrolase [Vicinamibacteria bacterium]|jgi:ADP-ribose pyrophosphatase YjhB (NUDIX family)
MKRAYPREPSFGVGAVIIETGKVLLVRRGQPPLDDRWTLPGGLVELGESIEQAVIREVEEETGWLVRVVKELALFDFIEKDDDGGVCYHYVLADFLCAYVKGELAAASDVKDVRLVSLDELAAYELMAKALEVIEEGRKHLRGIFGRHLTCVPD